MATHAKKKNIVVMGGGTGTHTVLRGLKRYTDKLDISAVVSMADSGGSTGRLRDEFGYLPVGDVRMALLALARGDAKQEELLRELFTYRFENGNGLSGHNVGNLLLVALTDIVGSEAKAVEAASEILHTAGTVLPVTTDNVHLVAEYEDGTKVQGEHLIDEPPKELANQKITSFYTTPAGRLYERTDTALREADMIVLGPGDLFSSLLANCVIGGVPEALCASEAKLVFIMSLMEQPGQTRGRSMSEITDLVCQYAGRCPDVVCINDAPLPEDVLERYGEEGNKPIADDTSALPMLVKRADLLASEIINQSDADTVKRSLIRHDSDKLAAMLLSLLE